MKIPLIIHQVYEDPAGPSHALLDISKSWKEHHPTWEYRFWARDEINTFLETCFPELIIFYKALPFNVQRWDFIRYLILYKYGGLYVDMDYECLEPIESIISDSGCCLGLEPYNHVYKYNREYIVGNAFMSSTPDHPFFKLIIEDIKNSKLTLESFKEKAYYILNTTGPFMMSKVYENYDNKGEIKLLSPDIVAPLDLEEIRMLINGKVNQSMELKIEKASAIHYFMGSWWEQTNN